MLPSCKENVKKELVISEPRSLTQIDTEQLIPTKTENQQTPPSYSFSKPDNWNEEAETGFRKINFSTETDTEIYLSESRGDILSNVNRWLGQFGNTPIETIEELKKIKLLKNTGYMVSAIGDFKGFGAKVAKENYMLVGAIVNVNEVLVTVKMTGPKGEVEQELLSFMKFCESLH